MHTSQALSTSNKTRSQAGFAPPMISGSSPMVANMMVTGDLYDH